MKRKDAFILFFAILSLLLGLAIVIEKPVVPPLAEMLASGLLSMGLSLPVIVKYWDAIKEFVRESSRTVMIARNKAYTKRRLNPRIEESFTKNHCKEPVLKVYKHFVPLRFLYDKAANSITIKLTEGGALAIVPSIDFDTIVEAISSHVVGNLSTTSIVKNLTKLQRAIDLLAVTLIVEKTGIDSSLTIALKRHLQIHFEDDDLRHLFEAVRNINMQLKSMQVHLEPTFLRILLVEISRGIFCGYAGIQ